MTEYLQIQKTIPFYQRLSSAHSYQRPDIDMYVIAHVLNFTDVVVEVTLPEYCDAPAIIPTSEIKVKRGRRVADYVKKGQEVVAQVIRVDEEGRLDLSMKSVTKEDEAATKERYAKAQKVHSIICSAAGYKRDDAEALYKSFQDIECLYTHFEQILVGDASTENQALLKAIQQRMPIPSYTCEKEIVLRNLNADQTADQLTKLVEKGFKVYITAPPKYKISITMPSRLKAEAALTALSS